MPFDQLDHASPNPSGPNIADHASILASVGRGLKRCCPACGRGPLFSGFLKVRSPCPQCGSVNDNYPADDFAPYVTIFLVLHLMVPALFFVDHLFNPSVWLEAAVAIPVFMATCTIALRYIKGGVIGFAYAINVTRAEIGGHPL